MFRRLLANRHICKMNPLCMRYTIHSSHTIKYLINLFDKFIEFVLDYVQMWPEYSFKINIKLKRFASATILQSCRLIELDSTLFALLQHRQRITESLILIEVF